MSPDANLALMPAFWHALLARADAPLFQGIAAITSQAGFAVYRNTCTKACVDALAAQFPSVLRLVGDDWFRAAATEHLRTHPPRDGRLLHYGNDFPPFLRHFAPAAELPYLAGVAQLDWLWTEAHTAAEATPLPPDVLATLDENALHTLSLQPHPAARWHWHDTLPLFSLWRAAREQHDDPNPAAWVGDGALITRPRDQVLWAPLSAGGNALLNACAAGQPIAQAIEAALTQEPALDLGATLGLLIQQGAFCATAHAHQEST
jgi:hypothetical protein